MQTSFDTSEIIASRETAIREVNAYFPWKLRVYLQNSSVMEHRILERSGSYTNSRDHKWREYHPTKSREAL